MGQPKHPAGSRRYPYDSRIRPPAEAAVDMATFQINPRTRTTSELVIHRLYEITSEYATGFDAQVQDLLAMGCERFELEVHHCAPFSLEAMHGAQ